VFCESDCFLPIGIPVQAAQSGVQRSSAVARRRTRPQTVCGGGEGALQKAPLQCRQSAVRRLQLSLQLSGCQSSCPFECRRTPKGLDKSAINSPLQLRRQDPQEVHLYLETVAPRLWRLYHLRLSSIQLPRQSCTPAARQTGRKSTLGPHCARAKLCSVGEPANTSRTAPLPALLASSSSGRRGEIDKFARQKRTLSWSWQPFLPERRGSRVPASCGWLLGGWKRE